MHIAISFNSEMKVKYATFSALEPRKLDQINFTSTQPGLINKVIRTAGMDYSNFFDTPSSTTNVEIDKD